MKMRCKGSANERKNKKKVLVFIFPTFVADDRWFLNAAYLHGSKRHKGTIKRGNSKQNTVYCYKKLGKETTSRRSFPINNLFMKR